MIMSRSDDVKAEVLNALHWDLAVPRHRVKVEVENGWVTMSGMVDQPYQLACANPTHARFRAWSASSIKFSSRPAQVEQGSLAVSSAAVAVPVEWAPELEVPRGRYRNDRRWEMTSITVLEETKHERHGRSHPPNCL